MFKSKQKVIFYSLILFSTYSAITLGQTWDEGHLTKQGQIAINYLLSTDGFISFNSLIEHVRNGFLEITFSI